MSNRILKQSNFFRISGGIGQNTLTLSPVCVFCVRSDLFGRNCFFYVIEREKFHFAVGSEAEETVDHESLL